MKINHFYLFTFLIAILLFSYPSFSSGGRGQYLINCKAFDTDSLPIKNAIVFIKLGQEIISDTTDENGNFEITIAWSTPCPTGTSKRRMKKLLNNMNPKFIYIYYKDKKVRIENDWQSQGKTDKEDSPKKLRKEYLYFC